jgi:hypothetical protein
MGLALKLTNVSDRLTSFARARPLEFHAPATWAEIRQSFFFISRAGRSFPTRTPAEHFFNERLPDGDFFQTPAAVVSGAV